MCRICVAANSLRPQSEEKWKKVERIERLAVGELECAA